MTATGEGAEEEEEEDEGDEGEDHYHNDARCGELTGALLHRVYTAVLEEPDALADGGCGTPVVHEAVGRGLSPLHNHSQEGEE
jgi:hypothetical protein